MSGLHKGGLVSGGGLAADAGTASAMTIFVETTGSDGAPGTASAPVQTINGALAKIGPSKRVRTLVNIRVGAGSFGGFNLDGFEIDSLTPGVTAGISILGTLVNATLGAGTATGTLTAAAAGNAATPSFSVSTDSGQAWTVNALKGLAVEILSGTGVGTILPIISNTATALTVGSATVFGGIGSTYAVRDWGTVIATGTSIGPVLPVAQGTPAAATVVGVSIRNCSAASLGNQIRIENIKISMATNSTAVVVGNPTNVIMARCCIAGSALIGVSLLGPGPFSFIQGVMKCANGASTFTVSQNLGFILTVNTALITNAATGGTAFALNAQGTTASLQQCSIDGHTNGISVAGPGQNVQLSGTIITLTGTTGFGVQSKPTLAFHAGNTIGATGLSIINGAKGLEVAGPHAAVITTLLLNTVTSGVLANHGAHVQLGSASTFTTVTNELVIDGTANTLAAMRAAGPPALLSSPYFSIVSE